MVFLSVILSMSSARLSHAASPASPLAESRSAAPAEQVAEGSPGIRNGAMTELPARGSRPGARAPLHPACPRAKGKWVSKDWWRRGSCWVSCHYPGLSFQTPGPRAPETKKPCRDSPPPPHPLLELVGPQCFSSEQAVRCAGVFFTRLQHPNPNLVLPSW